MQPIYGLFLYLALSLITALVASKKGRSGVRFFLVMLLVPVPIMIAVSYGMGDSDNKGLPVALAGFAVPIIGFITALMSDTAEQAAVRQGEFGEFKKCPFCAESVRLEAKKCKHCHSDLL